MRSTNHVANKLYIEVRLGIRELGPILFSEFLSYHVVFVSIWQTVEPIVIGNCSS